MLHCDAVLAMALNSRPRALSTLEVKSLALHYVRAAIVGIQQANFDAVNNHASAVSHRVLTLASGRDPCV